MDHKNISDEKKLTILRELVEIPSPSGFETNIQSYIKEKIVDYIDDVNIDVMGNLIGIKNKYGRPKIMIMAHCDETGLMISHITDDGYLYFKPIGMIDNHLTPGKRVIIHSRKNSVLGVIGRKPLGLINLEDREKVMPIKNQWIDIGVGSKEEAEDIVSVGDPVTFAVGLQRIGEGDNIVSKALDDKLGILTLIEIMRKLTEYDNQEACVCMVSTVQEEIGLRGATTAAYQMNADAAIIVDIGWTTDTPDTRFEKQSLGDTRIGKGPILDKGGNNNPVLYELLLNTATENKIPVQLRAMPMPIGTDARVVQISREGVATVNVSLPLRYTLTPSEVASLKDVDYTSDLITLTIRRLNPTINFSNYI